MTGVTGGLGRQMATRLLEGGDRAAGTGRNTAALEKIAARYGDAFWPATLDGTDIAAVKDTIDRAAAALGNVDVAVNNAGYGMFGAAEEFTDEQIAHHLATNLTGSRAGSARRRSASRPEACRESSKDEGEVGPA
ncbi:SDR family NAD(P)-dependent oxidoreductase [Streptomyces nodosus]|uniref:SDR family NAD(P)-dependent oxidoreductase n=1 Tax=Streptomyces nodosus TaxID=40318 RepID=UPI003823B571